MDRDADAALRINRRGLGFALFFAVMAFMFSAGSGWGFVQGDSSRPVAWFLAGFAGVCTASCLWFIHIWRHQTLEISDGHARLEDFRGRRTTWPLDSGTTVDIGKDTIRLRRGKQTARVSTFAIDVATKSALQARLRSSPVEVRTLPARRPSTILIGLGVILAVAGLVAAIRQSMDADVALPSLPLAIAASLLGAGAIYLGGVIRRAGD